MGLENFDLENLNQTQIEELYKAISSNDFAQLKGPASQTGGSAFIPESLENTLRTLTFTDTHLKLWKNISKIKAYSTVEEHNVINSNGQEVSGFQAEGLAGIDTSGDYSREFAKVKCLNTTRSVTHLINNLVKTTDNPEAVEINTGMKWIMGQAEQGLFYGNSKLAADQKEGLEWDGILTSVYDKNVLDLRGADLEDTHLNTASNMIINEYGFPNAVYMGTDVAKTFSENFYPDQRAIMNSGTGVLTAGTVISRFNTVGGALNIEPDIFLRRGLVKLNPNEPAYGQEAPSAPTVAAALGTGTKAKFTAGTYKYAVVAMNNRGKSVPVEAAAAVVVTASDLVKGIEVTITNSATQMFSPEFFIIYRTEVDGSDFYEIGRVGATSSAKSGVTMFTDNNETLPKTGIAIVGDYSVESLAFKELAPIFKLDYAMTAPIKRFGIFLYGTPVVYAPKRFVTIKNIKI